VRPCALQCTPSNIVIKNLATKWSMHVTYAIARQVIIGKITWGFTY
jgi:hypothetical protein